MLINSLFKKNSITELIPPDSLKLVFSPPSPLVAVNLLLVSRLILGVFCMISISYLVTAQISSCQQLNIMPLIKYANYFLNDMTKYLTSNNLV